MLEMAVGDKLVSLLDWGYLLVVLAMIVSLVAIILMVCYRLGRIEKLLDNLNSEYLKKPVDNRRNNENGKN